MKGFIEISRYAGMREDLVQAGGGNSSYKESEEKMYIKASGFRLADVSATQGYAVVNPAVIRDFFLSGKVTDQITEQEGRALLDRAFVEGARPSIETFLHAVSGRYTLHTHPVVVNALACREEGMQILKSLFPDAMMVPYATPGIALARAYFREYQGSPDIVFLQNHGLVVSADTAHEVIERTETVLNRLEDYLSVADRSCHAVTRLWRLFPEQIVWQVTDEHILRTYRRQGLWNTAFCPDCVVFLGKRIMQFAEGMDIETYIRENGKPVVLEYDGHLYILAESVDKALMIQSVLSFSAQVMELNNGQRCNVLSETEQDFLLDWDAERYRQKMR